MTGDYPSKRVFEVARELKISTPEIIDYLTNTGHDVKRKQMQPVTEPMYIALLHKFDRGRFEQYLISHGIIGDELRRLTAFLDEQRRKAQKPGEDVKPEPVKATPRRHIHRKVRAPAEKSETIKVTFFRRELPPKPPATPIITPSSIFGQTTANPTSIPTSPLTLQLIKLALALPHDRKESLIADLRLGDSR